MNISDIASSVTKSKVIIAQSIVILILSVLFFRSCRQAQTGTVLPSMDSSVAHHDVQAQKPVQALNKKEIARVADIPSAIVKDDKKEILATAKQSGPGGTSTIVVVLDAPSGLTSVIEKRPFMEMMSQTEIGGGYTIGSLGQGYAGEIRHTVGRVWNLYGDVRIDVWYWTSGVRKDEGHGADGQVSAFATWRF